MICVQSQSMGEYIKTGIMWIHLWNLYNPRNINLRHGIGILELQWFIINSKLLFLINWCKFYDIVISTLLEVAPQTGNKTSSAQTSNYFVRNLASVKLGTIK